MTDTPEERRIWRVRCENDHVRYLRYEPVRCSPWCDAPFAAAAYVPVAAVVDEAAKERARIVKQLRETGGTGEQRWATSWAADLIERGSGVPEGDDPTASA